MIITEKDIGRKVFDGEGDVETIVGFDSEDEYPVKTDCSSYTSTGVWGAKYIIDPLWVVSNWDLVGFLDEKEGE